MKKHTLISHIGVGCLFEKFLLIQSMINRANHIHNNHEYLFDESEETRDIITRVPYPQWRFNQWEKTLETFIVWTTHLIKTILKKEQVYVTIFLCLLLSYLDCFIISILIFTMLCKVLRGKRKQLLLMLALSRRK